ncbi:hypothetical protein PGC35_20075 [Psychrobacillus sp. PGGUH221]|uniref:hypothetical protein n=1 Tax=Psychrobacillus sp. PGGUH221 TaxID=3020058 RepID=UPI0035C716DF
MKKIFLSALIIPALLLSPVTITEASTKVMWGKTELRKGQIGKITVLNTAPLYQNNNDGIPRQINRSLSKGEEFRVYSYKGQDGGFYGLGGGLFVKRSNVVQYETPSKTKLALLENNPLASTPENGKKYSDGWVAPVLKSSWSADSAVNYRTLQNELGFVNGGSRYTIAGQMGAIQVIYQGPDAPYEVGIRFTMWDGDANGQMPQAYRIPIVAKEVFKLYFEGDGTRVWNYLNSGDIPDDFTAGGRSVHSTVSTNSGVLYLEVGHK